MPEINVNLIHDLKERHAQKKTKPPFVTGLRTGYVRAWLFVVFKVWLVLALVNGVTALDKVENDIALLDNLVRNDFSNSDEFFNDESFITIHIPKNHHNKKFIDNLLGPKTLDKTIAFLPRGPEKVDGPVMGLVAGDSTPLPSNNQDLP